MFLPTFLVSVVCSVKAPIGSKQSYLVFLPIPSITDIVKPLVAEEAFNRSYSSVVSVFFHKSPSLPQALG